MSPDVLFRAGSILALVGWASLVLGILTGWTWLRVGVAGRAVPILLSIGYTVLAAIAWPSAEGGFGSLSQVAQLFADPRMLLAGWVHYFAFDLLVGGWIADEVDRRGLTRWLLVPALPLTLMFGPAGVLVLFIGVALLRTRAVES